jgi:hypothetical protein
LQDARTELRQGRQQIRRLEGALEHASRTAEQRALALRSVGSGDLQLLAAPVVDYQRLLSLAHQRAVAYRTAQPFPHFIADGLLHAAVLEEVLEEFDAMERRAWHHSDALHERKWSTEDFRQFGPFTSAVIAQLNGGPFVSFLGELTGIAGLVPDPHLRGGGLHEIRRGGLLGVHADFNIHPRLKLYRRLNLLIYLNKDWDERWGGALEFWDRNGQQSVQVIPPLFNRMVIFDTSNLHYHGHPYPLDCPPDRSRKSIALYYYSGECPTEIDREAHGTVFVGPAARSSTDIRR